MVSKLPSYILKNCTIYVPSNTQRPNRVGQCSEVTIPVIEKTMEGFRNAGMVKERMVSMGHEATTCEFKDTAFDPEHYRMYVSNGPEQRLIVYGYLEDEDGTEHEARFEMTGDFTKIDPGSWAPAQKAELSFEVTVHTGSLFIDNEEVLRFSDFEVALFGVVQNPGLVNALRLN